MENFTINRELCELYFNDRDLKPIDVDLMEVVWLKIREKYQCPTSTIRIGFGEAKKTIGRYSKKSLIDSVKRLGVVTIETNQKSNNQSQTFALDFQLSADHKSFTVTVCGQLFGLFQSPKTYNEYDQSYVYQFNEKYSKLLYKFLIGYKFLKGKSIYVEADVLMKVMNIGTDRLLSKIQYDIFKSSVDKINKTTDLNVSFEKDRILIRDDGITRKYKITFNNWENKMEGKDLKRNKASVKTNEQIRIDTWIEDLKSEIDFNNNTTKVPMVVLRNLVTHLPLFIDNEYRLADPFQKITNTPKQTLKKINEWIKNDEVDIDVELMDGYAKEFGKMCLLSPQQLKQRNLI